MKLSWNEIRARAAAFAEEWKDASYEKGEAQSFYNDFFEAFGVRRRTVARYEAHVAKLDNSHGYIDLFWPGKLIVEHLFILYEKMRAPLEAGMRGKKRRRRRLRTGSGGRIAPTEAGSGTGPR